MYDKTVQLVGATLYYKKVARLQTIPTCFFLQDMSYSSKRNSGSSFIRRSGDYSRSPPIVFDNPAYRRSFEFRPNRSSSFHGSWYDPDAANYEYSLANANLVTLKQSSPKGRSVSSSRLFDKQANTNPANRTSLREYVPKVLRGSGDISNSQYKIYTGHNGSLPNGINHRASDKRNLPRTDIEGSNVNYSSDPFPRFRQSYRSRSFEPDLRPEPINRPEVNFSTVDNRRGKRYSKHGARNNDSSRKRDKHYKSKSQRENGSGAHIDKIHRSNSTGRTNHQQDGSAYPGYHPDGRIISSNLHSGTYAFLKNEPPKSRDGGTNGQRRPRSPSIEDKRNNCYEVQYRPVNGKVYMYQTKL